MGIKLRPVPQRMILEMHRAQCDAVKAAGGSIAPAWEDLQAAASRPERLAIDVLGVSHPGHLHYLEPKHINALRLRPIPQAMLGEMYKVHCDAMTIPSEAITTCWADLEGATSATERAALDKFGVSSSEKLFFLTQSQINGLNFRPVPHAMVMEMHKDRLHREAVAASAGNISTTWDDLEQVVDDVELAKVESLGVTKMEHLVRDGSDQNQDHPVPIIPQPLYTHNSRLTLKTHNSKLTTQNSQLKTHNGTPPPPALLHGASDPRAPAEQDAASHPGGHVPTPLRSHGGDQRLDRWRDVGRP